MYLSDPKIDPMKYLYVSYLFLFLLSFSSFSQPAASVEKKGGIMMVQEVVDVDKHTAQQLYEQALTWSDNTDAGEIEIKTNEEGDKIEGYGKIFSTHFYGNNYSELHFDVKIEFKTNRFRITCTKILIAELDGQTVALESFLYVNTGEMLDNRKARQFRTEANRAFSQFIKNLTEHMNTAEEKEFSDW